MELVAVIGAVFGVLQIILFFKVWGMTNNVKKLRERISPLSREWAYKGEILKGNIEEAKKILLDNLIYDIQDHFVNARPRFKYLPAIIKYYRPKFENLNFQMPEDIEKLERLSDIDKHIYY